MSFIFYDTETTGTNTAFDQILQFGAIKTDYEFNEVSRFEIRCRLLPYIVPAPGAMYVTGVSVEQLNDPGLPSHYQMVRAIRAKLIEWSPAIFIGHNSLGFDEHLLRQALYKTLHAPYLTNTNGNCRTDSLRMIQAVARFAPNAMTIPIDDRGRQVFKLDRLAPANGFDHRSAHDAMGDVEATIYMCRMIAERVPAHWSNFVRFSKKAAVIDFTSGEDVFALTDFYYAKPYSWMVTVIGANPENGSEMLVFDLSQDPEDLVVLSDDDLAARLAEKPKPVRGMRTNAGPIVLPYDDAPSEIREALPDIDILRRRAGRVRSDSAFSRRLIVAFLLTREQKQPSAHVEEQIYDEFNSDDDNAVIDRFHELDWSHRTPLIGQLASQRLRSLGQRLIYIEAPHTMSDPVRRDFDIAIARRLTADDETVPWLTYQKALDEIDELLAVADSTRTALLSAHRGFLSDRVEWATSQLR